MKKEKMIEKEKVIQAIFRAVDELNQQLPRRQRLRKSVDTFLFGDHGVLDSLGLVNLIVTTEQKIEEEFGIAITLSDEKALSQKDNSPFETIEKLADYISLFLEEKADG